MKTKTSVIASGLFIISLLHACSNTVNDEKEENDIPDQTERSTQEGDEVSPMDNPALMMGTDIGTLFKNYYKVGDYDGMIRYTDRATIDKLGADSLRKLYRSLELGYDMKLMSMTTEGKEKILHYETRVVATKGVRRLHVVIENDTARIVPQHLEKGDIFE